MSNINILYKLNTNNTVISLGDSFYIDLALQDISTGEIDVNTFIQYDLLNGDIIITPTSIINRLMIGCNTLTNAIIQLSYSVPSNPTVFAYISFAVVKDVYTPSLSQYINIINSELPQGFFINNPLDVKAVARLLIDVYNFGISTFSDAFPSVSTNSAWLKMMWSLTQPIFIGNPNVSLSEFFTFLNNISIYCTLNPFDLTWNISKFIYFISGKTYYVYADETPNVTIPHYTIYIIDPNYSSNVWILGTSQLGIDTILGEPTFNPYEASINFFIAKIIRAGTDYNVNYNSNFAALGLSGEVFNTYKGDIRLGLAGSSSYCIGYIPNNFTNANGRISGSILSESNEQLQTELNINIIQE